MLKSKVLFFLGLVALMLFSLSAGTLALFSSEAISSGNTISAGTLFIGGESGQKGMLDSFINLGDLVPGAEPHKIKLKVKNLGSMPAYINAISVNIRECNDKFLANALQTVCKHGREGVLYRGSLLALDGNAVPLERQIAFQPGKTVELEFSIGLDERVGNWYKGKSIDFSFTVYAGQKPDQEMGGRVYLAGRDNVQSVLDAAEPGDVVLVPAGSYGRLRVKPGTAVKAKDVVFDTVVHGFTVSGPRGGRVSSAAAAVGMGAGGAAVLQGFTVSGAGGIEVGSGECLVLDSIINSPRDAVVISGAGRVYAARNDFSGAGAEPAGRARRAGELVTGGGQLESCYNLGIDLDPEEHAL